MSSFPPASSAHLKFPVFETSFDQSTAYTRATTANSSHEPDVEEGTLSSAPKRSRLDLPSLPVSIQVSLQLKHWIRKKGSRSSEQKANWSIPAPILEVTLKCKKIASSSFTQIAKTQVKFADHLTGLRPSATSCSIKLSLNIPTDSSYDLSFLEIELQAAGKSQSFPLMSENDSYLPADLLSKFGLGLKTNPNRYLHTEEQSFLKTIAVTASLYQPVNKALASISRRYPKAIVDYTPRGLSSQPRVFDFLSKLVLENPLPELKPE